MTFHGTRAGLIKALLNYNSRGDWVLYFHSTLVRSLGEAGEIEPETSALMVELDVDETSFSDKVSLNTSHTGNLNLNFLT